MGADIYIFAERLTLAGWQPLNISPGSGDEQGRPEEFFDFGRDYLITYVLTGYQHRHLAWEKLPWRIVREPRGRPEGLSTQLERRIDSNAADAISWVAAVEILDYDWRPLCVKKPLLKGFIDRVSRLNPPEEYRFILWLGW